VKTMRRWWRSLFRRQPTRRLTGVVQYQSVSQRTAWICPHENLPIFTINAKVLRRSGFLWDRLQPGDRVYWPARDGIAPRRLYLYRRAAGR
jgi:hypothetical protein